MIKNYCHMNSFKRIFCVILVLSWGITASAQASLTPQQEDMFRGRVRQLIQSYSEANEITKDYESVDPQMVDRLIKSFVFSSKKDVFNDLLPNKVEGSRYLTPAEYAQFAQKYYPEGLDVKLEIVDIIINREPMKKGGYYEAIVRAKKEIRGFYNTTRIHNFSDELYFYVQGTFVDGNIDGIGISMVADIKKHAQKQANRKYRGLYAGVSGGYSYSTLFSSELISNGDIWQSQFGNSFLPTFELHYMLSRGFGFGTGIRIGSYKPHLVMDSFQGKINTTFFDIDQDQYWPIYNVKGLEEIRDISTIDVPLLIKFRTGYGKSGLYIDAGLVYSMYRSMEYTLSGMASRSGEYPNLGNVILEDIEAYGYFTNKEFSSADVYTLTPPNSGFSAMLSFGLTIVPVQNIMLRVGLTGSYGLTDISYDAKDSSLGIPPVDYYHTTGQPLGETLLHSFSIDFGVYYRIFKN